MTAKRIFILLTLISVIGCGTLTSPGPALENAPKSLPLEPLRALATEIERAVAAGDRQVEIADREGLIINTPQMKQAIRTRATRIEVLNQFLDTGHAWERRDGLIWIIRSNIYKKSGTRRDLDRQALVVWSENRDRWTLYQDLVKINRLPLGSVSTVQRVFAEARIEFLNTGQKYEQKYEAESGEVVAVKD